MEGCAQGGGSPFIVDFPPELVRPGARAFGFPVAWIDRTGAPLERLGAPPSLGATDLSALTRELA